MIVIKIGGGEGIDGGGLQRIELGIGALELVKSKDPVERFGAAISLISLCRREGDEEGCREYLAIAEKIRAGEKPALDETLPEVAAPPPAPARCWRSPRTCASSARA